jgi:hypothetical protein
VVVIVAGMVVAWANPVARTMSPGSSPSVAIFFIVFNVLSLINV